MSDQEVRYTFSLEDLFSGKIKSADGAINHMEGSLHSAGSAAKHFGLELAGALGIGFGIFKGIQLIEEGKHAMHELELATAQVKAALESTGGAVGKTFEELEGDAKRMASALPYSRAQITDMQAILLTFPKVTRETFDGASMAIADMATRLHHGLDETAIQVGKALQDPIRGITALRRVGVNFDDTQKEIIKHMVETGHVAKAQAFILKELNTEFAGSAKAAANVDPLFRYNKIMASIKLEVGELAIRLLHALTPALQWVANAFKSTLEFAKETYHWFDRNKKIIGEIAIVLGTTSVAWGVYTAWAQSAVIWSAIKATAFGIEAAILTGLGTAVEFVNAMFIASPIGWIVAGVAAVTAAVVYCYTHFKMFRAILLGVWETIKEFGRIVGDIFIGLGKIIQGTVTLDFNKVKEGWNQTTDAIFNAGTRIGKAFVRGYNEGMADVGDTDKSKTTAAPKAIVKTKAIKGDAGETGKSETGKASGSKNVVINIKIDNLIKDYSVKVSNVFEGIAKTKELVTQALLSAVNDSQITAGQ